MPFYPHDIKEDDPSKPIALREPAVVKFAYNLIALTASFAVAIFFIRFSSFLAIFATLCMLGIIFVLWAQGMTYYYWNQARKVCEILHYDPAVRSEKQWLRSVNKRGELEMNIANCDIEHVAAGLVSDLSSRMKQRRHIGRLLKQDVDAMLHNAHEQELVAKVYEELAEQVRRRITREGNIQLETELLELAQRLRVCSSVWSADPDLPPSYGAPPSYVSAVADSNVDVNPEIRR